MPGHSAGAGSAQPRGHESWSHIPARAVNWMRVRYRTKLAGLAVVAIALTGLLLYVWIDWGERTNLVIIKPGKLSANWLATPPYVNSLTRDSLDSNVKNLKPFDEFDLLDPASDDWKKLQQERAIRFGGPDGKVLLFYINALGVACATNENDDNEANLIAYTLPADESPFDSNRDVRRFSLEALLDQIVACDSGKSGTKIVLIDSQPVGTPSNPGLLVDRFPQAVHDLYERKYKNDDDQAHRLVIVSSHSPGQRNWPAPELDSSVFGYFVRAALLGAADGATGDGHDNKITLDELCQYLAWHVTEHVSKYRMATQNPMILGPVSLMPEGNKTNKSSELTLTYCNPSSSLADSTNEAGRVASERISRLVQNYHLPQKWQVYADLESSHRLDRDPLLAGRAAALLSRMEQLVCEFGIDTDELVALETEWIDLIKSIDKPKFPAPVSLAEAEWLDQQEPKPGTPGNSNPAHLPNEDGRDSLQHTLSGWVKLQKIAAEKPKSDPAVEAGKVDAPSVEAGGAEAKSENKPPDAGKAEVAAPAPDPEAEDIKKRLLEIERQPWLIAAMLWDGICRNDDFSPDFVNLDHWLKKLDVVSASVPGSLSINELIEMKFLHLLAENVDWKSASSETISPKTIELAVRRAVQCRQACENFAINVDPRVLIWVSDEFHKLEDTRRIAEDYLFANQFETAVGLFESVIEQFAESTSDNLGSKARSLADAFSVRNEVARKSPYFAMLIARQILRNETSGKDVPSGVDFVQLRERWLTLAKQNHELANELSRPSTGIEEAVTSESIRRNTENILNWARDVKSSLDFLEGQLGEQRNYLVDIKTDDTQAMVYIPDLLLSPLVTTRREDLRARYLQSISRIAPDVSWGQRVQSMNVASATGPQQQFQEFLRSAGLVNQQVFFTPLQRSISARPFRQDWETTRISSDSFKEIEGELEKAMELEESLPNQRSALQNSDYWLRCVAAELADYQSVFAVSENQPSDHFGVWGRTGSELNRVQESLHTNLKIERVLADFWGNNLIDDPTKPSNPYFQRIAREIYDRLGNDAEDHRKILDATLGPLFANRLNSARAFQIACDDYQYFRNEAEEKSHSFSVRANTELDQRAHVNGMDLGPIAVAQLQLLQSRLSQEPVLIKAIDESGKIAERRIAYDLDKLRTGNLPNQPFYFSPESLPPLGNVQAVLSFRGHLADAQFQVRGLDKQPDDFVPKIKLAHIPSTWRAPTVLVNSDERAVTNVVFVLDCSASMRGSFRAREFEGIEYVPPAGTQPEAAENTTRFQFLKRAIVERLDQMRLSKLYRVGIVAVGSRVNFKFVGKAPSNELEYSELVQVKDLEVENIRPKNDAHVTNKLTSRADWPDEEWTKIQENITTLQPHGQTPLYAGMLKATEMLNASGVKGSKVIVVISDGVEEVYEFREEIPQLDEEFSRENYKLLKQKLPADNIQVFFVGFDLENDQSESAQAQKRRMSDLFSSRLEEIESLATKRRTYYPSHIERFRKDLDEIARASRFLVSRSGQKIAEEELNQGWQPADQIEQFEPGFYKISIQNKEATKLLWLEDGEFITLGYDGSELKLAHGPDAGANAIHSVEKTIGRDKYSISLFQPNLQRPDMIPFEFLFERVPNSEFSYRPNRLCLEILPDRPSAKAPAYLLQDYRFVNKSEQNAPAVQFASPALKSGSYTLRLWTQPFQEKNESPSGQVYLADEHMKGPTGALRQPQKFGADEVVIEAWGDSVERSVTIRLTCDNPQALRTLLVDLFVEDSPSKARNGIDFPINRVFAEPVLLTESTGGTDPKPVFVEHTFLLDKQYGSLPISFSVRPLDSIFGTPDSVDFRFQKD